MSDHDDPDLPDPAELFERMSGQNPGSSDDAVDPTDIPSGLPDPAELFRRMEEEYREQAADESSHQKDLPDPAQLFRQMEQEYGSEPEDDFSSFWAGRSEDSFLPDSDVPWEAADSPLPFLPDPDHPGLSGESPDDQNSRFDSGTASPKARGPDEGLPYLPDPDQPGMADSTLPYIPGPDQPGLADPTLPFIPSPDQPAISEFPSEAFGPVRKPDAKNTAASDPTLPYIPGPDEPAQSVELPGSDETLSDGFLKELKNRFRRSKGQAPEGPPRSARSKSASPLPSPEELFRRMKAEREEAALNFESEPGAPLPEAKLPTPDELFRRMEQEYEEHTGSQLPELPDLDALKAELEAEERALLDPDVEADLAGPERFVQTVSDSIFSREQTSLFSVESEPWAETETDLWDTPEIESPSAEKPRLPFPQKPPVPTPPPSPETRPRVAPAPPAVPPAPPEVGVEAEPDAPSPTGTVQVGPEEMLDPPVKKSARARRRRSASYARRTAEEAEKSAQKQKFKRFSRQKLAIFTRQMAVMLKSGIQLHMAVQFAADSDPDLHEVLTAVMKRVESGYTFSGALGETSRTFDTVYVGLIQSGEMSGRLHEIMARLADALEREVELRKRLISVVTYPLVLLLVCLLGTLGFMFFILPTLVPLFEELAVDLPLPTKILLSSREAILPVLGLSLGSVFLFFLTRDRLTDAIRKRPMWERRLAQIPFHIPVLGQVYDKIVTARVLYSLSTMLDVGITLNQALARTEVTAGNALVSFRLGKARMDLADGVGVTDCFRMNQLFSPSALYLISAGEESARLAEMFAFVARIFDEDVEYALQTASSVLEPIIMVVMGVIVGFITIAAALPTIQLLQNFT